MNYDALRKNLKHGKQELFIIGYNVFVPRKVKNVMKQRNLS